MSSSWQVSLAVLALAVPMPAAAQTLVQSLLVAADPRPFGPDDLLWMDVRSGDVQLAGSMNVYASRGGVFVPLGEFARVMDLAVGVFPAQRRAEGWVVTPDRQLVVDLDARQATLAGRALAFGDEQAAIYDDDLYVRLDLLELLLPVRVKADTAAQVMELTTTETLPFQERQARARRQAAVGSGAGDLASTPVATPYRLFSRPAFDVNIGGLLSRDGVDQSSRYDMRAAADLLWASFEGYLGSNDDGEISDVRVTLSRKDPEGHALGPFGGTRAALGDVFTPAMPIGAGGFGGRGVFYTSAPLETLDLATPLNLRGELALGEEVELYVNEVLQSAQPSPDRGRYEFLDVPLSFGLNAVRLVFYGSQGQTREVVRRINFGSGQIESGRLRFRIGAVQQGLTVFDTGSPVTDQSNGTARMVAIVDYGLSSSVTVTAGAARFTPEGATARSMGVLGLRSSLGPVAAQIDAAFNNIGGYGATMGLAARPFGVSVLARHSEYAGGFVDETRQLTLPDQAALRRATDLRIDGQINGPGALTVPASLSLRRLAGADGATLTDGELRVSAPVGRYFVSSSIVFEDLSGGPAHRQRWTGYIDAATLLSTGFELRAGVSQRFTPDPVLETAYATGDWQISETNALRLGVIRTLGPRSETSLQASSLVRTGRFDLALNASYETRAGAWRVGLQLGFGFGYDPFDRRYRITRPGAASGGAVAINAWVDENNDGLRQTAEPGVAGLVAETPMGALSTDREGQALTTGLGDAASTQIRLNAEGVDDPFLVAGPAILTFTPRPGRTTVIDYPMQRSAEIELSVQLVRSDGLARSLAAVSVVLMSEDGRVVAAGRSDHAGVLVFEDVAPGTYTVRLDETQARVLDMRMTRPAAVIAPATGGFVRGAPIEVAIDQETGQ